MSDETDNQIACNTEQLFGTFGTLEESIDNSALRYRPNSVSLNIEEDFRMVYPVHVGLSKVFERQLFVVRFVLQNRNSLVVEVEEIL